MFCSRSVLMIVMLASLGASAARAQEESRRNEVGLLLGGTVTPDVGAAGVTGRVIQFGAGVTFQATYAREVAEFHANRLALEVPLLAAPSIKARGMIRTVPSEYASLFITPGIRVTLAPGKRVSPWVSMGGGYARFHESAKLLNGARNLSRVGRNTGALQLGAGADFRTPVRILYPIALRVEVRDVYSGKATYNVNTGGGMQHNLVFSGGFVVRM